MIFRRVLTATVAALLAGVTVEAGSLHAQGIPRGATLRRPSSQLTRIMVANPFVFATADSALAVSVGQAMRQRMEKQAPRSDFAVISDSMMNAALATFGYGQDMILNRTLARTLAQQISGRVLVTSQMSKAPGGQWTIISRLSGTNDDAGVTVKVAQAGKTPPMMGQAAVDSLQQALKVLADARECMADRNSKPDKAADKAQDALKNMPSNGLAHYCLAQLARDTATKIKELQATIAGDSLSSRAMGELAALFEAKGDTAQTVTMLQQMLRAEPTDQELRQRAFRYFLQAGRAQAAIEVADEGLKLDPTNWDLYDLKSNACLFASDFRCAVQALDQAYQVDSARADTMFFAKIQIAAEQQLSDTAPPATAADTAVYVKWARIGSQRFPDNLTLLKNLNKAYSLAGQVDSSLVVTRKILAADTSDVTPALAAAQALMKANRPGEADDFLKFVEQHGDEQAKAQAAGILVNPAFAMLQRQPQPWDSIAPQLRRAAALAPNASFAMPVFFYLAMSDLQLTAGMDSATEAAKSCENARKMDSQLREADSAFAKAATLPANSDQLARIKGQIPQLQDNVRKYMDRTRSMIKAYCK